MAGRAVSLLFGFQLIALKYPKQINDANEGVDRIRGTQSKRKADEVLVEGTYVDIT